MSAVPTVGRDAERQMFRATLDAVRAGRGAVVLIEGEAGIGKTHLLGAWREEALAAGLVICDAGGRELEQERPFGVMVDALGVTLASTDPEREAIVELLEAGHRRMPDWSGFQDLRFAIVEALAGLLEKSALISATLLVIDDLQWCDASSLITLGRAIRLARSLPLIVVCAYRPLPRSAEMSALLRSRELDGAYAMKLSPLGKESVRELVALTAGGQPGPSLTQQALRCAGNPLFITELVGALRREELLVATDAGIDLLPQVGSAPPPVVAMLVLRHLSGLPSTTIELVRLGAVLGSPFSLRDLAVVTGRLITNLLSELQPAVVAGLLRASGERLMFQHDLVRDAVYLDLGEAVRRGLHHQAAQALAAVEAPTRQVAQHFAAAARRPDPTAAEWLLRAGREAAPRDPIGAVTLLQQAVELSENSSADETRLALGQALAAAGRLRDAEELLRDQIDGAQDELTLAEARAALGQVLHLLARFGDAAEQLRLAAESGALNRKSRARLFAHSVMDRLWSGEPVDAAEPDADRSLVEGRRAGDRLAVFYALMAKQHIVRERGWIKEAVELARECGRVASAVAPDDEVTHYEMPPVHVRLDADLFDEALHILSTSPAWNEERGGAVQPRRLFEQMCCHAFLGAWDDAVAEGEAALSLAKESGTVWVTDICKAMLVLLLARRGEAGRAAGLLHELPPAGSRDDPFVDLADAYVTLSLGDRERARDLLESRDSALRQDFWVMRNFAGLLAQMHLELGDTGAIPELVGSLEPVAERARIPSLDALVVLCGAMATGEAAAMLRAVEILRSAPRIVDLATACEEAGAATRSPALLNEALALYEGFGARRDAARTMAKLRALGLRPGRRGLRRRPTVGWDSLTPTERRIAELVAEGLLYKEVAERLFISRRTVETHIAHVFGKLGIASRVELTRALFNQVGKGP